MRSAEDKVRSDSDYYVYLPSAIAKRLYFYPLITGYFYYEPGYYLKRNSYEKYLLMLVAKGTCRLVYEGRTRIVRENQVVLIDCEKPHEYGNAGETVLEVAWLHFDGPLAASFYELIREKPGNVITPSNPYPFSHHLERILDVFRSSSPVKEADISRRITAMLSELISIGPEVTGELPRSEIIENAVAFVNEHFREDLSLEEIASHASLSPFYFTRVFTRETGMTPHQYLIATRINAAKYLLQTGTLSIKEIAFTSGFHSESSFCSTFRKREGLTPSAYRERIGATHAQ